MELHLANRGSFVQNGASVDYGEKCCSRSKFARLSCRAELLRNVSTVNLPCTQFHAVYHAGRFIPAGRPRSTILSMPLRVYAGVSSVQKGDEPIYIVSVDARPLNVPLISPFTIALTSVEHVQNVAIRVELSDGSVGWGEAPTLPPVTAEDQPAALEGALIAASWLRGRHIIRWQDLLMDLSNYMPGHRWAAVRAGTEMAILDAVARSQGIPLWKFFGGAGNSITTDITIPICSPGDAAELAAQYLARGFETIKTKVGGSSVKEDVERLKAIRSGHPTCKLILDANCGYTSDESLEALAALQKCDLTPELLEQPVALDDWLGMSHVSTEAMARFGVPVAADESCRSPADAFQIVERKAAQVINIKLAKVGVLGAMEVARIAREGHLGLMVGGMVETRMAMGFSAHMAAGLGGFRFVDLDTPLLLAEDPVQGGYKGMLNILVGSAIILLIYNLVSLA